MCLASFALAGPRAIGVCHDSLPGARHEARVPGGAGSGTDKEAQCRGGHLEHGPEVSAIGLGCMGMSFAYGAPGDRRDMIALLHAAVDRGVTFFGTAQVYGPFSERGLFGDALAPLRERVVIATKSGFEVDPGFGSSRLNSGRSSSRGPSRARLSGCASRRSICSTSTVSIPKVPIEEVAGTVCDLIQQGNVRHFGLSEPGVQTVRRAHAAQPVAGVQSEYSLWWRRPEQEMLPALEELGIGFAPFSPRGKGLLTGTIDERRV